MKKNFSSKINQLVLRGLLADGTITKREISYPETRTLGELGPEYRTVLRTQPKKGSGLHIGPRPGQYPLACD